MNNQIILFVCANDVVLNQLGEFIRTLYAPNRGAFEGRVVVLTDEISQEYYETLRSWRCEIYKSDLEWPPHFQKTIDKAVAFEYAKMRRNERRLIDRVYTLIRNYLISKFSVFGEFHRDPLYDIASVIYNLQKFFRFKSESWQRFHTLWRRKHLSKLLLLNYLDSNHISKETILIMADSDMLVQSAFSSIVKKATSKEAVYVAFEEKDTLSARFNTSPVYWSNILAYDKDFFSALAFGRRAHEINVGFVMGYSGPMRSVFEGWRSLMINPKYADLWYCHSLHFWHEQDFFRAYLNLNSNLLENIGADSVLHGCGGATKFITYDKNNDSYFDIDSGVFPTVIHFAGQEAKRIPPISHLYTLSHSVYIKRYAHLIATEVQAPGSHFMPSVQIR